MNIRSAARIKVLRNRKSLSQQELADKLNINQQTISKYELGTINPQIDNLIKMADFFNCSIDYLIGRDNIEMPDGFSLEEKRMIMEFRALPEALRHHIRGFIAESEKRKLSTDKHSAVKEANTND